MRRKDWYYVPVEKALLAEIEKTIKKVKRHGIQVYKNRVDFTREAIHRMLEELDHQPRL